MNNGLMDFQWMQDPRVCSLSDQAALLLLKIRVLTNEDGGSLEMTVSGIARSLHRRASSKGMAHALDELCHPRHGQPYLEEDNGTYRLLEQGQVAQVPQIAQPATHSAGREPAGEPAGRTSSTLNGHGEAYCKDVWEQMDALFGKLPLTPRERSRENHAILAIVATCETVPAPADLAAFLQYKTKTFRADPLSTPLFSKHKTDYNGWAAAGKPAKPPEQKENNTHARQPAAPRSSAWDG